MQNTSRLPAASRVLLACAAAALLASGGCYRRPTVTLKDAGLAGMDFRTVELVFDLDVHNPNGFQIGMWGLEYTLSAAGEVFASGALSRPLAPLAAMQKSTVRVPMIIEYARLRPLVDSLRVREPIRWEFAAKATFNFLGVHRSVKLSRRGEIPALRAPAWRFRDIKLAKKGDRRVAQLVFEVTNPNDFELPLVGLTGALKYAGEVLLRVDYPGMEPVPPGKTVQVVVPVRVRPLGVARAVTKALADRSRLRFEGEIRLGAPATLKSLLFGPGDG